MPLLAALLVSSFVQAADSSRDLAHVDVRVDEARHQMVVTVGPFRVPQSMPMHGMEMMMMHEREALVGTFEWPVTTQFHGVQLAVVDGRGGALPRNLLHHTYLVNFSRRQLVHPITERVFSFGQETEDLSTLATIGMPMGRGQRMGILVMWANETGRDVDDAYVRYTFRLNPRRQWPRPVQVMPFFVDVHMVAGGNDTFSVAPGGRTVSRDFTVPTSGHLIAAGGHVHEHAALMRLEDVATGRVLATVRTRRDADGQVRSVGREILGLWGRGPHLRADRRYRLVVRYDNPTSDTLFGMMGMMGGLFVPDDPRGWPRIDATDPTYLADLEGLLGSAPATVTSAARPR